jgi:glutamyl-tRNA reductase
MPFVIGLNHQTAPIELREKFATLPERLPETLRLLKERVATEEAVVLSTCNRTEVYLRSSHPEEAQKALLDYFRERAGQSDLTSYVYVHHGEQAVKHLFSVASGLDSMVKGENEILAQVKQAYLVSQQEGFTGKLLNVLFQRSLYVGKRVRSETSISMGNTSVGSVAGALAERIFGDLQERCILILGAGAMAETTARHLVTQQARAILVANRTFERAVELAHPLGGQALRFEEGLARMVEADVVICSTAAPQAILSLEHLRHIAQQRRGRSLFLIDIAMPRNVDPAVDTLDNVYLYNLDDLQMIVNENMSKRSGEMEHAAAIVEQETSEFTRWLRAHREGLHSGLRHRISRAPMTGTSSTPAPESDS